MKTTFKILFVVVLSILASSCGNKGDLYLPKKNNDKTEQVDK